VLGNQKRFNKYYAKPITAARDIDATDQEIALGKRVAEELQAIIKPYMLQRLKKDILANMLPPKQEFVVWTHLSEVQRQKYTEYVQSVEVDQEMMNEGKGSALVAITWLKKLCGIPLLVDDTIREDLQSALAQLGVEGVVQQSAKLGILIHMIQTLSGQGHRTLIFSQSTKMLDIIQFVLASKFGDRIARIDGTTAERNRQRFVDSFNADNSRFDVMLISTRAGTYLQGLLLNIAT
jgi:SNF2 family DNA or RNA helicase